MEGGLLLALLGLMGTIIGGFGTWLIAKRQTSGNIGTSKPETLWEQYSALLEERKEENEALRAETLALRKEAAALREEAVNWRQEAVELRLEVAALRKETALLRAQVKGNNDNK